jgi:putative membrane protein insertion efficiency factor
MSRTPRILATMILRAYQLIVSPWLGRACRFEPSCSAYALEAVESHGAARGSWLTFRRLVRCHPWGGSGYDPVPQHSHDRRCGIDATTSH